MWYSQPYPPVSLLNFVTQILYHTTLQLWRTVIQITGIRATRVRKKPTLGPSVEKVLSNAILDYRATELCFLSCPVL